MDYSALRTHVAATNHPPVPEDDTRWLVGIVHYFHNNLEAIIDETSLVWIHLRAKTTVTKLKATYLKKGIPEGQLTPESINLEFKNSILSNDTTIRDINEYDDRLIILKANQQNLSPVTKIQPTSSVPLTPPEPDTSMLASTEDRPPWHPEDAGSTRSESLSSDATEHDQERDEKPVTARSPSPEVKTQEFFTSAESEMEPAESMSFNSDFLKELLKSGDTSRLEAAMKSGGKVLSDITASLETQPDNEDVLSWLENIETLRKQAKLTRTVVGVQGNTGAGKSSVINAVLDEERLVPTNCMRACTAVVTEISYNRNTDPAKKYRAEIDFIDEEEWKRELELLFGELLGENGQIAKEATSIDSAAGVAYAKVRAVYPQMTREEMARVKVDALMKNPVIRNNLGKTKKIIAPDADYFYRSLQQYVDSKEKDDDDNSYTSEKKKKDGPKKPEWWPLIKSVRIFVAATALSTGAVLVDLPGVQDSNAARAAVAEGYMKQCSGLWIVAPINRAVSDKAAQKLLGENFRRQMKFDGMFNNVTFICSKTDDISIGEAADSLSIKDQIGGITTQIEDLQASREALEDEKHSKQEQLKTLGATLEKADEEYEKWVELRDRSHDGETVFAPRRKSNKRKRGSEKQQNSSKRRSDGDGFIVSDDETASESDSDSDVVSTDSTEDEEVQLGVPLTVEEIKTKMDELKTAKADGKKIKTAVRKEINTISERIRKTKLSQAELEEKRRAICIAGRNQWSRSQIKVDYAAGIKELDEGTAEEEDPTAFNPEDDLKDYDAVARNLPVFCVSSRAYQTLSGRFKQDGKTTGFENTVQTEIPQLQQHCMKLTEENRAASCKIFLNNLTQMLLSMSIWASNDGTGIKLTDKEHEEERQLLARRLRELELGFDKAVDTSVKAVEAAHMDHISKLYSAALVAAESKALPTATSWGAAKVYGGYVWSTFRALCRRQGGPFNNATGTHDLNKQLSDPLERYLVNGWEKCFQRTMPAVLKSFSKSMSATVRKFHDKVAERARSRGVGIAGLSVLDQKLPIWEQGFENVATRLNAIISERQKEANREITPVIASAMSPAYERCMDECGPGSYARMKGHMTGFVGEHATVMFKRATQVLDDHLDGMRLQVEEEMKTQKRIVIDEIRKDYMNVIAGVQVNDGTMTGAEREMRSQVYRKVQGASAALSRLVAPGEEYKMEVEDEPTQKVDEEKTEEADEKRDDDGEDREGEDMEDVEDDYGFSALKVPSATKATEEVGTRTFDLDGTDI